MAGIGFELKKLFVGRGVVRKLRAYAYAGIICSGTMILAIALLLCLQEMAKAFGAGEHERELLVVTMVYALFLSMLLTSCFQTYLSRYVADLIYQEKPQKVMPSLLGGALTLMIPGGILYALLLGTASELTATQKLLNWTLFMVLIPTWLQMSYITAAKDYRSILTVFALGIAMVLMLGFVLLMAGVDTVTALQFALVVGYGLMLVGFMRVLLIYFPSGEGSAFAFIGWLSHVPDLLITGFLGMAGAFVHIVVMWFSPLGMSVTGAFRQASLFDAAAFYAFLVTVPTNINFVVSIEVNFYGKYRQYFDAITGGGTIGQIAVARDNMRTVLHQEVGKLVQVQLFFLVVYMLAMRYFLSGIGFTSDMITMFQVMSIGYSAYALGNSLMLLLLYFNDRRGAFASAATMFVVNLGVSLLTMNGPVLFYGLGVPAGGMAMFLVAMSRLIAYVNRIDFHVFCSQPVFNAYRAGLWVRLADALDARAERRMQKYAPRLSGKKKHKRPERQTTRRLKREKKRIVPLSAGHALRGNGGLHPAGNADRTDTGARSDS